jgi:hypothetical protein
MLDMGFDELGTGFCEIQGTLQLAHGHTAETNQETSRGQYTLLVRVPCSLVRLSGKSLNKPGVNRSSVSHQEQELALEVAGEPGHFMGHVEKLNIERLSS